MHSHVLVVAILLVLAIAKNRALKIASPIVLAVVWLGARVLALGLPLETLLLNAY